MQSIKLRLIICTLLIPLCGCSGLFPKNIEAPDSIFTDSSLGTKGSSRSKAMAAIDEAVNSIAELRRVADELPQGEDINKNKKEHKIKLTNTTNQMKQTQSILEYAIQLAQQEAESKSNLNIKAWNDFARQSSELRANDNSPTDMLSGTMAQAKEYLRKPDTEPNQINTGEYEKFRNEAITTIIKIDTAIARLAYTGAIATRQQFDHESAKGSIDSSTNPGVIEAQLERDLVTAWNILAEYPSNSELAKAFLTSGISLIDHRCGRYFNQLGLAAQRTAFANRELSITSGVVGALQGLTGVAAKDIAITGSGLGFLSSSSNAYGDIYIFTPDIGGLEDLILRAQKVTKDEIASISSANLSKPASIALLQGYEKTCEVKTIKRLLNASLASAQPIATYGQKTAQIARLMESARAAIAKLLDVQAIDNKGLSAIYWAATNTNGTEVPSLISDELKRLSKGQSKALIETKGNIKTLNIESDQRSKVLAALLDLVYVGKNELDAMVQELISARPSASPPEESLTRNNNINLKSTITPPIVPSLSVTIK